MRQEPALQPHLNGNGPAGIMNPRPAVSNDPVEVVNGNGASDIDRRSTPSSGRLPSEMVRDRRRASLQARPTSAPNGESSQDESEIDRARQRPKGLLHRSKSDYGPRGEDRDSQEEEIQNWGARHGFEDHYASEEYVSQLANVSRSFFFEILNYFSWQLEAFYFQSLHLPLTGTFRVNPIMGEIFELHLSQDSKSEVWDQLHIAKLVCPAELCRFKQIRERYHHESFVRIPAIFLDSKDVRSKC
jgi:hypothetical protein